MTKSSIHNALLRCTRKDGLAAPVFELVNEKYGIWVLELSNYEQASTIEEVVESIYQKLLEHRELLAQLAHDCSEYTLHITYIGDKLSNLTIPPQFLSLADQSHFTLEIYRLDREVP